MTNIIRIFSLSILVVVGCSKSTPEQAILNNIDALQTAIEDKDNSDVREHISLHFIGGSGATQITADNLQAYLAGMFLRHAKIGVLVSNTQVTVSEFDPYIATSTSTVAVTGAEGLIPDAARLYKVNATWRLESDQWKLLELTWK